MKKQHFGFTMIEMLAAIAIAAILVAMAAPNLTSFLERNQSTNATNQLVSNLLYTRNEAVKRGFDVTMCVRNAAGTGCNASGSDYGAGVLVFTDYDDSTTHTSNGVFDGSGVLFDTNGDGTADKAEEILMVTESLPSGYHIVSNLTNTARSITYQPSGRVKSAAIGFSLCLSKGSTDRSKTSINMTGRARSTTVDTTKTCATS